MNDPMQYMNVGYEPLTVEALRARPEALRQRFVEEAKALVHASDYDDALRNDGAHFDFQVAYDALGADDLAHPFIANAMSAGASQCDYIQVAHLDGDGYYAIVARGGNPMGFVVNEAGELAFQIYDGVVRRPGESSYTMDAECAAIHAALFVAHAGQSVNDVKAVLEQSADIYGALVGPTKSPILGYRLGDIPEFLRAGAPEGDLHSRFFWVARPGDTKALFAAHAEPPMEHAREGMVIARRVALAASKSHLLADLFEPGSAGGGLMYGVPYNCGFHTADGAIVEGWFRENGFNVRPVSEILGQLYFVRVVDAGGNPISWIRYASTTVNAGLESDMEEVAAGIYAFDVQDPGLDGFELIHNDARLSLGRAQLEAGQLREFTLG